MRTSILSRSVIALATLTLTSAALTVAPAGAATPSGVTRGEVLAAASAIRAETTDEPSEYSEATQRALRRLALKTCDVDTLDGDFLIAVLGAAVEPGRTVDGLVTSALIYRLEGQIPSIRGCSFGALTSTQVGAVLTGTSKLVGSATISSQLSGDVFTTPVIIDQSAGDDEEDAPLPTFSAAGDSVLSLTTTTSIKTSTPKTAKQKKAAKKNYEKKLKAAQKSYTKALRKACDDKRKISKAKKAHAKKRASAKKAYEKAIAKTPTIVRRTTTTVTTSPFSATASYDLPRPSTP